MNSFTGYRVLLGVTLLLASGSMFLSALLFTRLADTTTRTDGALCTFRNDVRDRANATSDFLLKHPKGIPGVPVETLHQSLTAQRRVVKALRTLRCPPTIG